MIWLLGDIDDEKSHLSYCNKYLEGPIISSMKGHKVLETINEGLTLLSYSLLISLVLLLFRHW